MRLTELAVKRPVAMSMVIMLFVVLGLVGYSRLGADLLPKTNMPFVTVVTAYPGAGAREVESQVVDPVEEALATLSNVKKITSSAAEGVAVTVIEFSSTADGNLAAIDVQRKIDAIRGRLPRDIVAPRVEKFDPGADAIMTLAVSGDTSLLEAYAFVKDRLKDRLQQVPGVGEVGVFGGREREIQVDVDRAKLEYHGLSLGNIVARLKMENINMPSGTFGKGGTRYDVRVLGEFRDLEDLRNLELPLAAGGVIRLGEIATVRDGTKAVEVESRFDGRPAVGLYIKKQGDANIVDTAEAIRKEVRRIQKELPKGLHLAITHDSSEFIRNSLHSTLQTLFEGVVLTGLVLLVFLREWRSTLIAILAIPTSVIATFMMMYFAGFTFNVISLLGLALAVGILVDDSIVVLENIHRHLKMGKGPAQAALDGRTEIGMAAVAITFSDVAVFGPIAFMSGMVGQFFRQFGFTVVFATLFSLFVSFTLTPMLSALWLKGGPPGGRRPPADRASRWSGLMAGLQKRYRYLLIRALERRWAVVAVSFTAFALAVSLIPARMIGAEFMPKVDSGGFTVTLEMPAGTPLEQTDKILRQLEERLMTLPEVEHYLATAGRGGNSLSGAPESNRGTITVSLKPRKERTRTVFEVAEQVRSWGKTVPGAKVTVAETSFTGGGGNSAITVNISGPDQEKLAAIAREVEQIVKSAPGAVDVTSTWQEGRPEVRVEIDRLRAAAAGLTVADLAQAARTAINGEVAGVFRTPDSEYDIRVKLAGLDERDPAQIGDITASNLRNTAYRLSQVADVRSGKGPTEIRHENRQRVVTVSSGVAGRPVGDVVQDIKERAQNIALPPGFHITYGGDAEQMADTFKDFAFALALSIVLVYMVLAMLYESYLTPVIRMLSLPLGMIGALLALLVTGKTLNLMSLMGIIMLDGLVAKNGTLLIDYTHTLMERGLPLRQALVEAGITRLRPILMTSMAMIFGMLPTALALGDGAEVRSGMAVVLIGGMITSTAMTLLVIPVAYTLVDDFRRWLRGRLRAVAGIAGFKKEEAL